MDYRNAKHISGGRIDCEVNHPIHGWVPYTLDPADTDQTVDNAALLTAIGNGATEYVPLTQEELDVVTETKEQDKSDALMHHDLQFRVMSGLLFDLLKAAKSGNFIVFDDVTDKETFSTHLARRIRAEL
tara:strand:- start:30914 stop:31300 length:387 start_codon:yes stop_codon:yes gene_type:complete